MTEEELQNRRLQEAVALGRRNQLEGLQRFGQARPYWFYEGRAAARRVRPEQTEGAACLVYVALLFGPEREPCFGLYVGMTSLSAEIRFEQHKQGRKAGKKYVTRYGVRLLPRWTQHLTALTHHVAISAEAELAASLRGCVPWVEGGH